jgi:diketogulonate reductase-like aldo/keto reductase
VELVFYRRKTIEYFKKEGLHVMSYRGLNKGEGCKDLDILRMANETYKKTPAQILGRFLVQQGITHIPKSTDIYRMKENMQIFDFNLTEEDMQLLMNKKTTQESLNVFKSHYLSRRVKDTPLERNTELLSASTPLKITVD